MGRRWSLRAQKKALKSWVLSLRLSQDAALNSRQDLTQLGLSFLLCALFFAGRLRAYAKDCGYCIPQWGQLCCGARSLGSSQKQRASTIEYRTQCCARSYLAHDAPTNNGWTGYGVIPTEPDPFWTTLDCRAGINCLGNGNGYGQAAWLACLNKRGLEK